MNCANCNKPAHLACAGCNGCPLLPGEAPAVYYCNATCQKADWPNHKPTCLRLRERQILYRVASTAQRLYYMYREASWFVFDIKKVDTDTCDLMHFRACHPESDTCEKALTLLGNDLLADGVFTYKNPKAIAFPVHLFQSEQDQKAALSYIGGIPAVTWMAEFINGMMNGIVQEAVEVEHHTAGEKLRTKFRALQPGANSLDVAFSQLMAMAPFDAPKPFHNILKVTLRSGEEYAVDLACAQYGHFDPVTPWDEFEEKRILDILEYKAPELQGILQLRDYSPEAEARYLHNMQANLDELKDVEVHMLEQVNMAMLEWQNKNMSLNQLWKLPETQFVASQKALTDWVEWSVNVQGDHITVHGTALKQRN